MKIFSVLLLFVSQSGFAGTACTDFNTQTRIAREAVKSLVALSEAPRVIEYYGGVERNDGSTTLVSVLPHYQFTKDWYKVSVRNSDCRVMSVDLFAEKVSIK